MRLHHPSHQPGPFRWRCGVVHLETVLKTGSRLEDLGFRNDFLVSTFPSHPPGYPTKTSHSCLTTVTYAIAYFLPIILREGMGFSIGESQCLVAPPYGLAGIVMFGTAWVGDRYRKRGLILIFNAMLCIIGLPIMGFHKDNAVRYMGVFFTVAGANANIPSCMAYQANNVRGQWSRALSSATLVGFGGIGGIASSLVFREQDAPLYRPGIYTAIAYVQPALVVCVLIMVAECRRCNILIVIIVGCLSLWFYYCNSQADRGKRVIENSPEFRYTI